MVRIAVLISGSGTNLQSLIDAYLKKEFNEIKLEISEYEDELELINKRICKISEDVHRDRIECISIFDQNDVYRKPYLEQVLENLKTKKQKLWNNLCELYDGFNKKIEDFLYEKSHIYGCTFRGSLNHVLKKSEESIHYGLVGMIPLLRFVASYDPWMIYESK